MLKGIHDFFDWEKHPGNVLYLAAPIVVIFFAIQFAIAYLERSIVLFVILSFFVILLGIVFYYLRKIYKREQERDDESRTS